MWEMKTLKDLVIIKAFVPEKIPKFVGTESMFDFVIWNLYDRIANGLKSFDLLCDNRRFYDAFLVAGNVLETCAVLSYIKDKQTEKERLKNLNKYLARSSAGQMVKILSWDDDFHNLPHVSWSKIEKILTNKEFAKRYHVQQLPSKKFTSLLMDCFNAKQKDKIPAITKLYNYVMKSGGGFDIGQFRGKRKIEKR